MSHKIIILQHTPLVTPGYFTKLMNEDLVETTIIRLDEGEKIPINLDIFDGMICLGGPMDTWMEEQYPWMIDEKNKICLLYTSPSPRDTLLSRMPSSA